MENPGFVQNKNAVSLSGSTACNAMVNIIHGIKE
jgi:hypothetical protein